MIQARHEGENEDGVLDEVEDEDDEIKGSSNASLELKCYELLIQSESFLNQLIQSKIRSIFLHRNPSPQPSQPQRQPSKRLSSINHPRPNGLRKPSSNLSKNAEPYRSKSRRTDDQGSSAIKRSKWIDELATNTAGTSTTRRRRSKRDKDEVDDDDDDDDQRLKTLIDGMNHRHPNEVDDLEGDDWNRYEIEQVDLRQFLNTLHTDDDDHQTPSTDRSDRITRDRLHRRWCAKVEEDRHLSLFLVWFKAYQSKLFRAHR